MYSPLRTCDVYLPLLQVLWVVQTQPQRRGNGQPFKGTYQISEKVNSFQKAHQIQSCPAPKGNQWKERK